jgi:hypothetical protein
MSKEYPLVFVDTETTSLRPDREIWEIAMIRRELTGTESTVNIMIEVHLNNADPVSLNIGKFWERHPDGQYMKNGNTKGYTVSKKEAAAMIFAMTFESQLVGAIPSFDANGMETLLRSQGFIPMWHHRLICVESMTVGLMGYNVGGLAECAKVVWGLKDYEQSHTAFGDADLAKRLYNAIIERERDGLL